MLAASLMGCQQTETTQDLISQSLIIPEEVKYETIQALESDYTWQDTIIKGKTYEYPVGEYLRWDVANSRVNEMVAKDANVIAGEELASFDVEENKADLAELQLKYQRQQSQLADGKGDRQNAIAAAKADVEELSGTEREIAVLKLEKLQAEYEKYCYQAEQNLADLQKRISELSASTKETTLYSPGSGTISVENKTLRSGDAVAAGTVLYYFKNTDTWFLSIDKSVPYNSVVYFYGKEDFEKNYPDNLENAKVLYTGTVVTSQDILPTNGQKTLVKMDTPCQPSDLSKTTMFVPGNTIQGLISVPGALNAEGDLRYVHVLEDDVVKKRYVIWGPGETILDGITQGQTLILD